MLVCEKFANKCSPQGDIPAIILDLAWDRASQSGLTEPEDIVGLVLSLLREMEQTAIDAGVLA